jgi:sodium-independent sulfate anion transporter 11
MFLSELPASIIVLLIEHIAISKSFGRINNYTINPSQELVAIGMTNIFGPFLGGYPATGSFSRTAIKSKSGVRTPFAGVITAIVVLLAIYALPAVFFYIPNASLSGVIIHAVGDLITPPDVLYRFWRVSPLEVFVFFIGVIVTIFSTIEIGIYVTVSVSVAIFLFRALKAKGRFLGEVKVHSVVGDHLITDDTKGGSSGSGSSFTEGGNEDKHTRKIFIPIDHKDGSNPDIKVEAPYPGVFVYRLSEGFNYPNANHYLDHLTEHIFKVTRRTNLYSYPRPGDRPWNDPGPRPGHEEDDTSGRPTLKAIILDFSSVNNVDITSVQQLIDVRNQLDKYTAPDAVDWHFASINNRWTKRALVSAGFGYASQHNDEFKARWRPIFSVAEIGGDDSAAQAAEQTERARLEKSRTREQEQHKHEYGDDAILKSDTAVSTDDIIKRSRVTTTRIAPVHGLNRPFFHMDLVGAVHSAIVNIQARRQLEESGGEDIGKLP